MGVFKFLGKRGTNKKGNKKQEVIQGKMTFNVLHS